MQKYFTDYPIKNSTKSESEVKIISYDGNKYATIKVVETGEITEIKAGYLYTKNGNIKTAISFDVLKGFEKKK